MSTTTLTADVPPNGCRWCGTDKRSHSIDWVPGTGFHTWVEPTMTQRRDRMLTNRARRQ